MIKQSRGSHSINVFFRDALVTGILTSNNGIRKEAEIKYRDIPKFTTQGDYHINVAFEDVTPVLDRYIRDRGLQMEPDFQRGHVWTEEQQIKYVEFMLMGGYSGKDIYFNHPTWHRGERGDMVLVDGLQRLAAIQAFMANKIKAFGHFQSEFDIIPYHVDVIFHVNCLKTRAEVLTWYVQLNQGGVIHDPAEIARVKILLEQETKRC